VLAHCLTTACSFSASHEGAQYRCATTADCPDGFTCFEETCVSGQPPDAGSPAADEPQKDARELSPTMVTASSDRDLEIPDASDQGISDEVEFADACAIIDITVDIDISHPWRGDLDISLTSPEGTEVYLQDDVDFDDEDDVIGTYPTTITPAQSLDAFLGENGAGAWTLWVADRDDQDRGTLRGWAVHLWCQ
jgi:subtilisin-like proprotein convertase family protein